MKIAKENMKITKALNSIYKGKARLSEHGVKRKDCRKIWSQRTSIYDDKKVSKPNSVSRDTGVPKTAACVSCGGCGLKTFHGADGNKVFRGNRSNMDPGHGARHGVAVGQFGGGGGGHLVFARAQGGNGPMLRCTINGYGAPSIIPNLTGCLQS